MKSRDDGQRDVGLEQRDPDLARGGVDVGVGEPALAAQVLEGRGQAVLQGVEHPARLSGRSPRAQTLTSSLSSARISSRSSGPVLVPVDVDGVHRRRADDFVLLAGDRQRCSSTRSGISRQSAIFLAMTASSGRESPRQKATPHPL